MNENIKDEINDDESLLDLLLRFKKLADDYVKNYGGNNE